MWLAASTTGRASQTHADAFVLEGFGHDTGEGINSFVARAVRLQQPAGRRPR